VKARVLEEDAKSGAGRGLSRLRSSLTWLPGVLLSIVATIILLRVVSWGEVLGAWQNARPWVIAPALAFLVLAQLSRAIGWRYLVERRINLARSFSVLNVSYLLNSLLPLRLGDLGRAVLVAVPQGERSFLPASSALSAVVVERVIDLLVTGLLGLAFTAFFVGTSWASRALDVTLGLAVLGALALLALGVARAGIVRGFQARMGRVGWLNPWVARLDEFLGGIQVFGHWGVALPALAGILGAWLGWMMEYWVMLQGFVPGTGPILALAALTGGALGVMLPSSPNALGVYEAAVVGVLSVAGMSSGRAFAFALSLHVLNTIAVLALGALGLLKEGQSLGSLLAVVLLIRGRKQPESAQAQTEMPGKTGQG
jgi:uncharacterized protein (TIRG00374 family)